MIKVLTVEQMREADRRTIEAGIPGLILMENAACRVVDFLVERYAPIQAQDIVIICGKGNNGGDGLAIARQLHTRFCFDNLQVVLVPDPNELSGDTLANYRMYAVTGGRFTREPDLRATLVIDALLGTGLRGPAAGEPLEWIRRINTGFPNARIVSVDIPSGLIEGGEFVRAHETVTFAAPKPAMVTPGLCEAVGEMIVARIGIPDSLLEVSNLAISEITDFAVMLHLPRPAQSHKGSFGHVLVAGGAPGKTGAAAMAGLAALRTGAGLVTVATSGSQGFAPELMTAPLEAPLPLDGKTVLAIGPGIGSHPAMTELVRETVRDARIPVVIDADGLNALAGVDHPWPGNPHPRILTPHPGEMSRIATVTGDRIADARALAQRWKCCVVLKGNRTVIANPDGEVFINPTGSPSMAKAGSGDILTGLIAGLVAQFPRDWRLAVRCAVYLHGRAGELAARDLTDKGVLATDLLRYLYAKL